MSGVAIVDGDPGLFIEPLMGAAFVFALPLITFS